MISKSTNLLLRVVFCSLLSILFSCARRESTAIASFMSTQTLDHSSNYDTATFGTGCFWCTEALFQQLEGVAKVTSGYSGGHVANPTYEQVCTTTTGHA
ncbi:MAG: peptide-methionine (S)-S-oxide reductase, partial [Ginsengibacter sp.]